MKNLPKKIYLQIGADDLTPEELSELDFNNLDDVCWCEDKIYDTDIEYVLVDRDGYSYELEQAYKAGARDALAKGYKTFNEENYD